MATEPTSAPVNGNYGTHQQYGAAEPNLSSQAPNHADAVAPATGAFGAQNANLPSSSGSTTSAANEGNSSIPKDEVGWYFVEQYYTTLSRNPEKLHLFYSKRSQFVSGVEAEKVSVSVGPRAISERIKELDIQDCKVRVSNVDSQESFKNIVVQVIGEMSNKAAPHRKFVQTFVLAEQPNGYFVLNDIFRYIDEEEEEEIGAEDTVEPGPPVADAVPEPTTQTEPKTLPSSDDPVAQERVAQEVDKKLEQDVLEKQSTKEGAPSDNPPANGTAAEKTPQVHVAEDAPAAAVAVDTPESATTPEVAEAAVEADSVQPEKPKDPDPTPVASPPQPTKATPVQAPAPEAPSKPAAPKTWANLVAGPRVAAPAVPSPASSTSPASSQPRAPAPPSQTQSPPAPAQTPAPAPAPAPAPSVETPATSQPQQGSSNGWQTAGQEHAKRQARPQSISGTGEGGNVLGYVKNVTDKVDASILKTTLQQYGKLAYFDVSRQKNCAFVEFADVMGYNAAVAANPHQIGGEQIYVEERRPRSNAYGGGYNGGRGGMRGGRGGAEGRPTNQGRGGFQKDGGRGGYGPRGRGGNITPRGRGQAQAA